MVHLRIIIQESAAAFLLFRHLRYRKVKSELPRLVKEGAIFVDVRTPAEFAAGARSGMAAGLLKRHGFRKVLNSGSWRNTL